DGTTAGDGTLATNTATEQTTTDGAGAFGVAAQSIGGGGGVSQVAGDYIVGAGRLELFLGSTSTRGGSGTLAFLNALGGVDTSGDAATAVYAQSIGGGGGYGSYVLEPARETGGDVRIELGG